MFPNLSHIRRSCLTAALAALAQPGCGPSAPAPEATTPNNPTPEQKKIQELSKKGYNFKEIRAIANGEVVPPPKKQRGKR